MKLHTFRSGKEPDVFAYTGDVTGANLPAELGPWTPCEGAPEVGPRASLIGVGASGPVFAAIQRDGYWVGRSEVIASSTGVPVLE